MRKRVFVMIPVGLAGMALVAFLGGTIVRALWNGLLPPLFGFPPVTFWQALGLLVLSRIMFGGFGMSGGSSHYRRRWEAMTPEERERVRERIRARWRGGAETTASPGQ
jgi:hypothetical protein